MTDLATRYGTSVPGRRLVVTAAAVLAVGFAGWLVWVMLEVGDPEVTSELTGFEVVDEHAATATFTVVRRSPEVAASCLLRAQAPDHAVVGELNVPVGPGGPAVRTMTETVRTERKATAVEMVGCRTEGQTRRR